MSHFVVAVISDGSKNLEDILAPYEEMSVDRYVKYTKEQAIEKERNNLKKYMEGYYYQEYLKDPEKYIAECKNEGHAEYIQGIANKLETWTDEDFYKEAIKYEEDEDVGPDGEIYSTYNPKSKWDWYDVGGRWSGMLPLKQENPVVKEAEGVKYVKDAYEYVNEAEMRDVIFKDRLPAGKELDEYYRQWESYKENEEYFAAMVEKHKDFPGFVKNKCNFAVYACVTPDGEWHEPGKMGWWGMSSATDDDEKKFNDGFYDTFIAPYLVEDDYTITMVDCHI